MAVYHTEKPQTDRHMYTDKASWGWIGGWGGGGDRGLLGARSLGLTGPRGEMIWNHWVPFEFIFAWTHLDSLGPVGIHLDPLALT